MLANIFRNSSALQYAGAPILENKPAVLRRGSIIA